MKLIIPDNNDPELLKVVQRLVNKESAHKITGIYGKPTKNEYLGSGRTNKIDHTRKEAEERVSNFRAMGISYEWSINDIVPRFDFLDCREKIIKELEWLESSSIPSLTVASYGLARLAERYCPNKDITVSFFAGVSSKKKLIQWAKLPNVRTVVLDGSTLRNLHALEELVRIGERYDARIRVIANLGCMSDCIQTRGHAIIKSYASINASRLHCRPFTYYCLKHLLENPRELLQLPIIRPEDLKRYEEIGVDTVKLVDRSRPTQWIEEVVGHYLNGTYHGNILDLTSNFSTLDIRPISTDEVSRISVAELNRLTEAEKREWIRRYRERLPEFIGVSINPDYDLLACDNTCEECNCDPSALRYDPERRRIVLAQLNEIERMYLFR